MKDARSYLAAHRFGFGASLNIIQAIKGQPVNWLMHQISAENISKELTALNMPWNSHLAIQQLALYRQQKKSEKQHVNDANNMMVAPSQLTQKSTQKQIVRATNHTIKHLITSDSPFYWRLVDFFSNHFSVTASGPAMRALAPTLEIEAIAPNIAGHFADMLLAVERHPAMLLYLNNERSIGPNSRLGKRSQGKKGLNENLAREILELHTLGVKAGYKQYDVTELARAITGWGVDNSAKQTAGFMYRTALHEPGKRQILGKVYPAGGEEQGANILKDLARNPNTAFYVSKKLVTHFISDNPPPKLIDKMVKAWLKTEGNLTEILSVMLDDPMSWTKTQGKFKTPREFFVSTCRVCELTKIKPGWAKQLDILGQAPFSAGSPAGYKDSQLDWAGPRAMMGRIEWANHISKFVKKAPLDIAKQSLGPLLSEYSEMCLARAESKQQATILLLMSPEFQKK